MTAQKPMLAESVHPTRVTPYIASLRWGMQLKADGKRTLITVDDSRVTCAGRDGQNIILPTDIVQKLRQLPGHWQLDGELLPGGKLVLFDLVEQNVAQPHTTPKTRFQERYAALKVAATHLGITYLPVAFTTEEKEEMFLQAQIEKREGVILRALDAPYVYGRRDGRWLVKCKFVKEADCHITALNVGEAAKKHAGGAVEPKDNCELTLYADDGAEVHVGKASTIGKKPEPQVGDVWEVLFLYVVNAHAPRLVQPRLVRKRKDKLPSECSIHQLDHCFTNKEITA